MYFRPALLAIAIATGSIGFDTQAQNVMSPAEFLGYELGERFTRHHAIVDYFEHVSDSSPRVDIRHYGMTNEGRPLVTAVVSSAENLQNLEAIRSNHLRVAGMEDGAPTGNAMAVVWLSYGVHGNESSSSEAAMKTLYELASGGSEEVSGWLENTVIIVDPCLNPDGRDRYVNWFNGQVGRFPNDEKFSREHSEPWPGGRTNHYYFDLNRDWAWGTQKETVARIQAYNEWMPHIHVDFHEQGINDPYYFAPAAEPYHDLITEGQKKIEQIVGDNNAQYFDANDWLYFRRERFDLLYPGYGDTWPTFNGAIGMTYEQAGGGRGGVRVMNDEDQLLTLTDRINHHHTAGLSTVEAAFKNRDLIVQEFATYYSTASEGVGPWSSYVIRRTGNEDNADALRALLELQGIDYEFATSVREVDGFVYRSGGSGEYRVEVGDLVVHSAQPKSRLLTALLEPVTAVSDSVTYDITAWSLPYAYDLAGVATNDRVESTSGSPEMPVQSVEEDAYGYLLSWNGIADARVLSNLLANDVRVRTAKEAFQIDGTMYDRGTVVVTSADNAHLGGSLNQIVRAAAEINSQPVVSILSGSVDAGKDLGSGSVVYLKAPSVMIIAGSSISSYATGELWNYFDNQVGYPVTLVDSDDIESVNLGDFDVIILPSGSYSGILHDEYMSQVTAWIRRGGKLIALESAARFLDGVSGFRVKRKSPADPDSTTGGRLDRYEDRFRDRVSENVTGALFRVRVDSSHPLAFGYEDSYVTLKRSTNTLEYLTRGWNVAVVEEDRPVSGFMGHKAGERVRESLLWGHETLGSGDVVYFADSPIYRGFWHSGMLALANAVFLVGQ
ncbi:MAG: zinc carboxypeptidase [Rhodothermales bacterium]|nr:zinc carboxypeptidase [Rhodothermales bacterium]